MTNGHFKLWKIPLGINNEAVLEDEIFYRLPKAVSCVNNPTDIGTRITIV